MSDVFDQIVSPVTLDESKDYFAELVGEGKKFRDPKELAKGKAYSDAHIANLEKTLAEMRAELQTRKTAEDLINQINLASNRVDPSRDQNPPVTEPNSNPDIKSGLTPEDVERLFQEREAKQRREANLNKTTEKLREIHGDNAAAALQAKASELGVDTNYLKGLAQDNPTIFLSLFNKPQESPKDIFNAPAPSTFRPNQNTDTGEKWSDYNKVKKENPTLYWSPKFQRKLMDAAERAMSQDRYEAFLNS